MKFLQKKKDVKATMKNFELQGKADFFGKTNWISKAMKKKRKETKANI